LSYLYTPSSFKEVFVDRGFLGSNVAEPKVYVSGQKKGITQTIKKHIKCRQAIEPHISYMKNDRRLGRNYLKGLLGNETNASLSAVGHNVRMILRKLRLLLLLLIHNQLQILA
jgi:IS5 family transposase